MDFSRFEQLVAEALDALPEQVTTELDNVAFCVEPRSQNDDVLGEYIGVPRPERFASDVAPLPDQIILYHEDIVDECLDDETAIKEEIRRTLWHEIAHHLGWDDQILEDVERGKGWRDP